LAVGAEAQHGPAFFIQDAGAYTASPIDDNLLLDVSQFLLHSEQGDDIHHACRSNSTLGMSPLSRQLADSSIDIGGNTLKIVV
jgi:hypothetical protein